MGTGRSKQRAPKASNSDEFPLWGVQLSFLAKWTKANVTDATKTTSQVCSELILPMTKKFKCSMVDIWSKHKRKANRFVSHSWSYSFMSVVDTLVNNEIEHRSNLDEIYVWIDTLVVNQHEAPIRPQSWWSSTFHGAIKEIGRVILVVEPWHYPKALTRAWCLWEIYGCARYNAEFRLALPSKEKEHFINTLISDFKSIQGMMSLVDSRKAEASNANDLAMIRKEIESSIGYEGVNRMVMSQIRRWLLDSATGALGSETLTKQPAQKGLLHNQIAKLYNLQGNLTSALEHQAAALEIDREFCGNESDEVARDLNNLGFLCSKLSKLDEALDYLQQSLSRRIAKFGDGSTEAARTRYNIGEVYETRGMIADALEFYSNSHKALLTNGCKDDAIKVSEGLGRIHRMKGDFILAEKCFLEALDFGGKDSVHPDIAEVWGLYAALLTDTDRFNEAEAALVKAREVQTRNLGDDHPNVAEIDNNLARLFARIGRYEDALERQKAALMIDSRAYGERRLEVARDHNNLGFLYTSLAMLKDAEEHMTLALSIREDILGRNHPLYARSLSNLAGVDVLLGRFTEAMAKYDQASAVLRSINVNHPDVAEVDALKGYCLFLAGELLEAQTKLETAISSGNSADSKKVEWSLWLAKCLTDQDKFEEAKVCLDKTAETAQRVCADLSSNLFEVDILSGTARYLEALGDIDEAIIKQRQALEKAQNDTLDTARDRNNLGYLLTERPTSTANLEEGIAALREAIRIRSRVLGEANPATLRSKYNLANALCCVPETYKEGIEALEACCGLMAHAQNKLHAFVAMLGLMRLKALDPFPDRKSVAVRKDIVNFLSTQTWHVVDDTTPLGVEALAITFYGRGDVDNLANAVSKYEAMLNPRVNLNLAGFTVLLSELVLDDEARTKLKMRATNICDALRLMDNHILRKRVATG